MATATRRATWAFTPGAEIVEGRTAGRRLGGGRRHEVYLAWSTRLDAHVALKIVRPDLVSDDRARRVTRREAAMLGRLDHPGLPRLYGSDADGSRPHIEMEFVAGMRLSTVIRELGPLDPRRLAAVAADLAATLAHVHAAGVLHLDTKPSNVVMGDRARLIDFSVARYADRATRISGFVGSDAYMSPEQANPERWSTIGPRSDSWGLAATLHRAVTGRPPFARGRRDGIGRDRFPQLGAEPVALPGGSVPPVLLDAIMSALRDDPADRPSAADMLDAAMAAER